MVLEHNNLIHLLTGSVIMVASLMRIYVYMLAVLFFSSFTFSVVNISINDTSLYFFLLIPFVDFIFIKHFFCNKIRLNSILPLVLFFIASIHVSLVLGDKQGLVKPLFMLMSVAYLYYIYNHRYHLFKLLYVFACFSVLFAVIQLFVTVMTGSDAVQPSSISKLIWGGMAIQTRPGFEDGIFFEYRFSGLSKEPGFFSSFIFSLLVFYLCDVKIKSKKIVSFLVVGLVVSLSKITVVFVVLIPVIYFINKYIFRLDRIELICGTLMLLIVSSIFTYKLYGFIDFIELTYFSPYLAETYLHRTINYYLLANLDEEVIVSALFFGGITQDIDNVIVSFPFLSNLRFVDIQPDVVFRAGIGFVVLQYGITAFLCLLTFLKSLSVSFYSFVIFMVITSNVSPFSLENWVVMGYLFLLVKNDGVIIGRVDKIVGC